MQTQPNTLAKSPAPALPLSEPHFLREKRVLQYIPVSRAELWNRVKAGTFPRPTKLSPRVAVWKSTDILRVLREYGCDVGEVA